MEYLVWIGPRDSDIQFSKHIKETICYYSEKNNLSYRKAHIYGKTFLEFIKKRMEKILKSHPDAQFIFYNPKIAYSLSDNLRQHTICLNDKCILDLLSNKIYTRFWLGNYVPVIPSILLDSQSILFSELSYKLPDTEAYIAQKNNSSGGFGTFLVSKENNILNFIKKTYNELFIVSPYIKNCISVNINAIIYEKITVLFPPSIQIIENNEERLLYHGADYIAAQKLPNKVKIKLQEYSDIILRHIQFLGYRGIIGIDFIIKNDNIYFQEINPRYQASSILIDLALSEQKLISLTEMNMLSFTSGNVDDKIISGVSIEYSIYKYLYQEKAKHLYYIEKIAKQNPYVSYICLDGWNSNMKVEKDSYCYSLIFSTNIASLNFDGGYNLYSNISGEEKYLNQNINSPIGLKIALLNQGCILDKAAVDFLNSKGIIKTAVFSSIDFQMSDGTFINAPVGLKFTDFTPFNIRIHSKNQMALFYYEQLISEINIEMQPCWNSKVTQNNVSYKKIAYLSTDRLRIKHEAVCEFKKNGKGCSFCSIPVSQASFCIDDIEEITTELLRYPTFRHILIGGGSGKIDTECIKIMKISKLIQSIDPKIPIYLMSLPPTDIKILEKYKNAGITEVAFNIEIWNRELAQKLMPGKGYIPLNSYLDILKASTLLWGTTGNVRTALIVGLNDSQSLLDGIQILCENGIQPMLSVFRPMPNTKMNAFVPLSNIDLLALYNKAQKICERYNLQLGPTCNACKNNMLAI